MQFNFATSHLSQQILLFCRSYIASFLFKCFFFKRNVKAVASSNVCEKLQDLLQFVTTSFKNIYENGDILNEYQISFEYSIFEI
jgi:hypothetical protein